MRRAWGLCGGLAAVVSVAAAIGVLTSGGGCTSGSTEVAAARAPVEALAPFIDAKLEQAGIPGFAIVLTDERGERFTHFFGHEVATDGGGDGEPAGPQSQWRVGSVSKMFTDVAVMQLVESGKLDLDAAVTNYLPDFHPNNPFGAPITLRQLMSHRAGLVREPPLGNYFDASTPSLAATVASLNDTTLVFAPGAKMKYSNAGIAVVGRVVEVVAGAPFTQVVRARVLDPMGLVHSAFEPTPEVRAHRMAAQMWTYWGDTFAAPTFELGMAPAGSLYAPIGDLGIAMRFFLGTHAESSVLSAASLAQMWQPQFVAAGVKTGYGFGFGIGDWKGHKSVGHDGAIYGFSTILKLLPDDHVGVAAVASLDVAHGVVAQIVDAALQALLAEKENRAWSPPPLHATPPMKLVRAVAGRYATADGKEQAELYEQRGELWLKSGATRSRVRANGDGGFVVDDLVEPTAPVELPQPGRTLKAGGKSFTRVAEPRPPPAPAALTGLIGEYGFDHNTLFVFEQDGQLHALIEWFFDYPLTKSGTKSGTNAGGTPAPAPPAIDRDVYDFPTTGLYLNEQIVFHRKDPDDPNSEATEAVAAGVTFPRRVVGTPEGVTFQIRPLKPIDELRSDALAATPAPELSRFKGAREPHLVELVKVDPALHLDVRYATTNNFMGTVFYEQARAFMQDAAAQALKRAHQQLRKEGFGLLIHDGYRPWFVTRMFWDGTPAEHHDMVADPSTGSRHNRGCAVDLTLCDPKTGAALRMPGGYDEFSHRSNPWYPGGTSEQRWLRDTLRHAMESEGFTVYEHEWWHFDFGAWREYPVLNVRFQDLAGT